MAKKKKNSNYVTEKRVAKAAEKEQLLRAKKRNRIIKIVSIALAIVIALAGCVVGLGFIFGWWGYHPVATDHAAIEIDGYGTVHIELYGNDAPTTVANFKKLASSGYYNGTSFHRIIKDFMAQGGDGRGTETIKGEFSANGFDNKILHQRGILSMARAGNAVSGFDTGSDQFFIVHKTSPHLDGQYAAFGKVTDGMDIIDKICAEANPTDDNGSIAASARPIIKSISIHHAH